MLRIALDVHCRRDCLRKGLCDLDLGHSCRIRMRLHHLQKAWPDMLGAGGMNGESAMSMTSRGGTDQLPCFRSTRFTDDHTITAHVSVIATEKGWKVDQWEVTP